MTAIKFILIIIINVLAIAVFAQTHTWQRTNPGGGGSFATAKVGPTGLVIAASDLGGSYYSRDGGISWDVFGDNVGIDETHHSSYAFHPTNPNVYLVGTEHGAYLTQNDGTSFTEALVGGYIEDMAFAPSNPQVVYAGYHPVWNSPNGAVHKSTNGGQSWSAVSGNIPANRRIVKVEVDPNDENLVFILTGKTDFACTPAEVYRSTNGGGSWTHLTGNIGEVLDIQPAGNGVIYLTTLTANCSAPYYWTDVTGDFLKSTNDGSNWSTLSGRSGVITIMDNGNIRLTDPREPYPWNSRTGTWESTNGGSSWTQVGFINDFETGYVDQHLRCYGPADNGLSRTIGEGLLDDQTRYWVNSQYVYKTSDGGESYQPVHTKEVSPGKWQSTGVDNVVMHDLEIHETNPNLIYAGYWDLGTWRSTDGGQSWESVNAAPFTGAWNGYGGNTLTIVSDPDRPNVVWLSTKGNFSEDCSLIKSTSQGDKNSWQSSESGLAKSPYVNGLSLDRTSPTNNRTLFVTSDGDVYKSTDDGSSWQTVLTGKNLRYTAIDPTNGNNVYAGGEGGLWASFNGGNSWSEIGLNTFRGSVVGPEHTWNWNGVTDIVVDPASPNTIFASVLGSGDGLYKSTDQGNSWNLILSDSYMRCVEVSKANPLKMYAGSSSALSSGGLKNGSSGIHYSEDGGATWTNVTYETPYPFALTLDFSYGSEERIFVGSPGSGFQYSKVPGRDLTLNLSLAIEGAYDSNSGLLSTQLLQLGLLPAGQPYTGAPWNYNGTEGMGWGIQDYPQGSVDWVLVSLRTDPSASAEVAKYAGVLLEDGTVYFPDALTFPAGNATEYHIVVQHRNHIGAMSASKIPLINEALTYDFRLTDSYHPGGSGQKDVSGTWVLFAGDGDKLADPVSYDINGADQIIWNLENGNFGKYLNTDYNLDGDVSGMDRILWALNNGIFSVLEK